MGTCTMLLEAHTGQVVCCEWSKGAGGRRWVLSGSWDKTLIVWDADSGKSVQTLKGHSAPVHGCGWSIADGGAKWTVSASYDETVKLWDAISGICFKTLLGHSRWVRCCQWSHSDGGKRWLATGSRDQHFRLWELSREDFPAAEEDDAENMISLWNSNDMQIPAIQDVQGPVVKVSEHRVPQRSAAATHQQHSSVKACQAFDGRDIANAENESLRAEVDKLKYALSVAHKAEMHAKELLMEERISKQNLQSEYRRFEEQHHSSLEEAREAGVKQVRDSMAQEWQEVSRLKSLAQKVRALWIGSRRRARRDFSISSSLYPHACYVSIHTCIFRLMLSSTHQ